MKAAAHFLKLETKTGVSVEGDAQVPGFEGEIEIDTWDWDVKKTGSTTEKQGQDRSPIEPSLFSLTKAPDRATVRLIHAMHENEIFPKGTLTLYEKLTGERKATGGEFHLVIALTDVVVNSYKLTVTSGDSDVSLDEDWELRYRTIEYRYDKGAQRVLITRPPGNTMSSPATAKTADGKTVPAGSGPGSVTPAKPVAKVPGKIKPLGGLDE